MKKIFLLMIVLLFQSASYAGINLDYSDGIYHVILSGDKIKKQKWRKENSFRHCI